MTFPPDDEYGELLRRALRAEADSVVPSPDGLEIIRRRIDQRGVRGLRHMLWWRVGASAAGAVLVAGAVVLAVPGLRDTVAESTGILDVGSEHEDAPTSSTVTRPRNGAPSGPVVIVPISPSPSRGKATPSPTQRGTGATTRPAPSPSDPCATSTSQAGMVEPEPSATPSRATPPPATQAVPSTCPPATVTQPPAAPPPTFTAVPSAAPPATAAPTQNPSVPPTETATPNSAGTPNPTGTPTP